MKVRVGSVYTVRANALDRVLDPHAYMPADGTRVRVVNQRGCPPANAMGHAYIATLDGKFIGLVSTGSLVRE